MRRDLRLEDQTALFEACERSREVVLVFVFDTQILGKLTDRNDKRVTFIHQSLAELDGRLKKKHSMLLVRIGDPRDEIPELAERLQAEAVFTNHDYEPYARQRDQIVSERLRKDGKEFHSFKDQVIFEKREITTGDDKPYKVFTPYKNAWLKKFAQEKLAAVEREPKLERLAKAKDLISFSRPWSLEQVGFSPGPLWLPAGESGASAKIQEFEDCLSLYDSTRDFPSIKGTSGLSVHLRFGTVSVRKLVRSVKTQKSTGAKVWWSELVWREFYQMILDQYPRIVEHAFRPAYDKIKWPGKNAHFEAWCDGRTGYPLVDAAMRQLNEIGWMHNRLRMVVASFLVKDCLIDYRQGEAYFAEKLLDFDLSANNGGWQWAASTGCDSQPYFRIFNPILQSERFDAKGEFIRQWCPELKKYSAAAIHFPSRASLGEQRLTGTVVGDQYPFPIVDHTVQKPKAIDLFKKARLEDDAH